MKREIARRYGKLMTDVATKEFYTKVDLTNRVNCYVCGNGHITKTKDVDSGVTPMFIQCEKCQELARSTFYTDIAPSQEPVMEWYRPTLEKTLKLKGPILDHVLNGGLITRKITKQPDSAPRHMQFEPDYITNQDPYNNDVP